MNCGWFAMLGSVQFNSEFCFVTEEVQNIVGDDLLSPKTGTAIAEKVIL